MMARIEVFADKCTGCRLCELACSLQKTNTFNPKLARIRVRHREDELYTPALCTQCEDEWCVKACPQEVIARDLTTQVILIDLDDCNGCGDCIEACPIGVMGWHPHDETPFKCDECEGQPVCVPICPADALVFSNGNW
ncbi:MAG: 4Fe-4S dicluster domain-containing protein [Anaerolineales bacterium]|nr:4Fe-4S dicluster domain-containing protein [Anaerolineales bacterium]